MDDKTFDKDDAGMRRIQHDRNNMLNAIIGSLDLAGKQDDPERMQLLVKNALRSVLDLENLLNDNPAHTVDTHNKPSKSTLDAMAKAQFDDAAQHELFFSAIEMTRMPMVVSDPRQKDNPIIFCNRAFVRTTGYSKKEIIGQNCRFLQGPATDNETLEKVRSAIADRREIAVEIENYRKDGSVFWNALFISPIFDREGELVYYFGSQLDVTRRREAEHALRKSQKWKLLAN